MLRKILLLMLAALLGLTTVHAQTTPTPTPANPNAVIVWPPPVYVLRGPYPILGSANLANMTNHFLEFRQLNDDGSIPNENASWLPATLPTTTAVVNDVLGVWNTATVPDGLYELRLTVNAKGGTPTRFRIAPIRVENNPPAFAGVPQQATPIIPTLIPNTQATLPPTPTALDSSPRATSRLNANIRRGDTTQYDQIGALLKGDSAPIIGISATGSGWYLVQLANGRKGWVAPSVVDVSGDLSGVPRVNPPPPPTPTPTPTPVALANLVANSISTDPKQPKCLKTFNVYVEIANYGSGGPNPFGGFVRIEDYRLSDGKLQASTFGAFGVIQFGQVVKIGPIPLTISTYYNEQHRLVAIVNPDNAVPETRSDDNRRELVYVLDKAGCP
jgi:hypothetical protein